MPEPPPAGSWYREIGRVQGAAYERNAFALGTEQEAAFLWNALALHPGARLLDVGCGTGRHCRAFRRRGVTAIGVDIADGLLRVAGPGDYLHADARHLPLRDGSVDAVMSVSQGGFGISPEGDEQILAEMARVLATGGRFVVTAFSIAFAVRWMADDDALDLERGVLHTTADVRDQDGGRSLFDLWTTCYTPSHLALLCRSAGLEPEHVWGCEPGRYAHEHAALGHPELLVQGYRP